MRNSGTLGAGGSKRCTVAFAQPGRQLLWGVEVAREATVAQVLEAAQRLAAAAGEEEGVPWQCDAIGIFGEPCRRSDVPREGDRVEIYRPLLQDPRERRREQARRR